MGMGMGMGESEGGSPGQAAGQAASPAGQAAQGSAGEAVFDLDAILDAELPAPPAGHSAHKGIDPKAVVQALPEEARKLIANLRDDYRRKTEALSHEKSNLTGQRATWLATQEAELRKQMDIPADIDPYTPEGLQKLVAAKVAEAMLNAQAPLRQQEATQARQSELASFRQSHPDIDTYKDRIVELVTTSRMKPEDAYWRAKGEASDSRAADASRAAIEADKARKVQAASAVRQIGSGSSVGKDAFGGKKFASAVDALNDLKARGLA